MYVVMKAVGMRRSVSSAMIVTGISGTTPAAMAMVVLIMGVVMVVRRTETAAMVLEGIRMATGTTDVSMIQEVVDR